MRLLWDYRAWHQELTRRIRHHTISDQVGEINAFLRGHYAYYAVAEESSVSREDVPRRGALLASDVAQPQLGRATLDLGEVSPAKQGRRY